MPRRARTTSLDALVRAAMGDVVSRAARRIAQGIAELAAAELSAQLERSAAGSGKGGRGAPRRPGRRKVTRWVADRRARRVPTFVIEMTGLKTKKQIVARYGKDAAFARGKPAPRAKG